MPTTSTTLTTKSLILPSISTKISGFMSVYSSDMNGRTHSYDYLKAAFSANLGTTNPATLDYLALNLYAYLASWGMLRNGFLLYKDYNFLIPVCQILMDHKYAFLNNIDPYAATFSRTDYINKILELKKRISAYFVGKTYYKSAGSAPITIKSVTDTLISKILLGSLGCIPAYDLHVTKTLKSMGLCNTISSSGLNDLLDFVIINKAGFHAAGTTYASSVAVPYSIMKYVDMALW